MQIELSLFVNVWEQINPSCCVFPQCFLGQLSSLVLCMLHLKHLQKAQVCQVLLQAARQRHMILAGISVAQKHFASQWTVKKLICPAPAAKGWFLLHWVEVRQYCSRAVGLWPFCSPSLNPCHVLRPGVTKAQQAQYLALAHSPCCFHEWEEHPPGRNYCPEGLLSESCSLASCMIQTLRKLKF